MRGCPWTATLIVILVAAPPTARRTPARLPPEDPLDARLLVSAVRAKSATEHSGDARALARALPRRRARRRRRRRHRQHPRLARGRYGYAFSNRPRLARGAAPGRRTRRRAGPAAAAGRGARARVREPAPRDRGPGRRRRVPRARRREQHRVPIARERRLRDSGGARPCTWPHPTGNADDPRTVAKRRRRHVIVAVAATAAANKLFSSHCRCGCKHGAICGCPAVDFRAPDRANAGRDRLDVCANTHTC